MEVFLLRHGTAENGRAGEPDSERALTAEGKYDVQRVVAAAKLAHVCPSLILSSPYKRAMQTANIAADLLDCKGEIVTSDALTPDAGVRQVWDELRTHRDENCVLIAGHQPLFGACASYLLGAPELQVEFPKAALMCIDVDTFASEPRGVLKWFLTPHLTV